MPQVVLVGLARSPASRQREFAAELVKEFQELAAALAATNSSGGRTLAPAPAVSGAFGGSRLAVDSLKSSTM